LPSGGAGIALDGVPSPGQVQGYLSNPGAFGE
jgi:hypothetical protein